MSFVCCFPRELAKITGMARVYVERRELPAELLRLLEANPAAAECTPPLDVIETDAGIEAILDIPGVPAESVDIVFARNVLLIAGHKLPAPCDHGDAAFHIAERSFGLLIAGHKLPAPCDHGDAAFHIAERSFGRFARAIGVEGAFDTGRATARLVEGELRVVLPRLTDRRGREIRIPIQR